MTAQYLIPKLEQLIQVLQAEDGSGLKDIGDIARNIDINLDRIDKDLRQIITQLKRIADANERTTETSD